MSHRDNAGHRWYGRDLKSQVGHFPGSVPPSREKAPSHLIQRDSAAALTGALPCPSTAELSWKATDISFPLKQQSARRK